MITRNTVARLWTHFDVCRTFRCVASNASKRFRFRRVACDMEAACVTNEGKAENISVPLSCRALSELRASIDDSGRDESFAKIYPSKARNAIVKVQRWG